MILRNLKMTINNLVSSLLNDIVNAKGLKVSDYNEKIFESGLIDSFGIVELVIALEKNFNIKIPYEDMLIQNFSSVNEISKLVERLKS